MVESACQCKAHGFSSVGKESACNTGDPSSLPGVGRSAGEVVGYPLQHSWASLVTQLVKNPPAIWKTWAQSLCWEDPLEKGMATHYSILDWRIHKKLDTAERLSFHFTSEKISHAVEQLSLCTATTEARVLWSPCSAVREAPTVRNWHAATRESPHTATKTQCEEKQINSK